MKALFYRFCFSLVLILIAKLDRLIPSGFSSLYTLILLLHLWLFHSQLRILFVFLKGKELHFQLDINALKDSLPEL